MTGIAELTVRIEGMHCAGCAHTIERGVRGLEGVDSCQVNPATGSALVRFDADKASEDAILGRIRELGYGADTGAPDVFSTNRREVASARQAFIVALILTVPLVVVAMWPMVFGSGSAFSLWHAVGQAGLAGVVLFYGGRGILADAWSQTSRWRANMNTLIAMGTLTAFVWSMYATTANYLWSKTEPLFFESAGMIITLILLGRFLEARSKGKAGQAIQALMNLRPTRTTAIINDTEVEIDAASVKPGMMLLVKPGERIPADGDIMEGSPVVDESILTGESVPLEKKAGDIVLGGSLNGPVPFAMKVTASGDRSFLATVIRLVSEAQGRKAPAQKLADRVAAVFVPVVIGIAAVTLGAWLLLDSSSPLLIRSVISVLIIACPCALGLATPTAVLAGTGRAARAGVIIRGGDILERLTKVDTVIFDKTGTLTEGKLAVVDVKVLGNMSEKELVSLAAAAEGKSEHPLARAVVDYARAQGIPPATVKSVRARPGFGIESRLTSGRRLLIGNQALMTAEGIPITEISPLAEKEMNKGRTVLHVALDSRHVGLISVADKPRPESRDVVTQIQRDMALVTMISGDNRRTAEGVA
ncbi:MAG: heavy metal translocating P-type ATPase, partial [Candidatus Zixiibacteriota bacterium]